LFAQQCTQRHHVDVLVLGSAGSEPDWVGGQGSVCLAFSVSAEDGRAIYVGFSNAGGVESTTIPTPPSGTAWHRVVDTGDPLPSFFAKPARAQYGSQCTVLCVMLRQRSTLSLAGLRCLHVDAYMSC